MTWKRWLLLVALLASVAVALGFFSPFRHRPEMLNLYGVVEIQEVRLGSKIGGRVDKVEILEGALVEPGQVLVTFEVPELKAQRQQMQARLGVAEADLEKAENGPRPEEKEAAHRAQESAEARAKRLRVSMQEELRAAESELKSAEFETQRARKDFERLESVFRQGGATRTEYDTTRTTLDRAQAAAQVAKARLELLRVSRPAEIEEADAEVRRAQANYELLKNGTREEDITAAAARVAEARGKLRELDVNLEEAIVRAPERAVVEVVAVRKGDLVAPNQPVLRVLRAADLWVKVYVTETDLGKVRLNQTVTVTIDSYPDKRFTGRIIQIASESEFTPRNVQSADERRHQVFGIKVRVEDSEGVFKSGMAAAVLVPLAE